MLDTTLVDTDEACQRTLQQLLKIGGLRVANVTAIVKTEEFFGLGVLLPFIGGPCWAAHL
jgi:hypothetical protein